MTHIEQAIRDAVENGYRGFDDKQIILAEWTNEEGGGKVDGHFLLDRAFWQALGKALGWQTTYRTVGGKDRTIGERDYLEYWHRFIDHLASGKDAESWFAALTKSK